MRLTSYQGGKSIESQTIAISDVVYYMNIIETMLLSDGIPDVSCLAESIKGTTKETVVKAT